MSVSALGSRHGGAGVAGRRSEPALGPVPAPDPRVWADPTRARVLRVLAGHDGPVPLSVVVAELGGHPNTTRGHLEVLRRAGLVRRVAGQPVSRGRPPWLHGLTELGRSAARRTGSGQGTWELTEEMAMAFVRYLATTPDPVGPALEVGRTWGASLRRGSRARSRAGRRRELVELLDRMGFTPVAPPTPVVPVRADAPPQAPGGAPAPPRAARTPDEIVLRSCPLLASATDHPEVVCSVHQGLVEGVLRRSSPAPGEGGGQDVRVELEPFGRPEGCRLLLTWGAPADPAPADPAPADPAPTDPTPADLAPADPAPS